MEFNRCAYFNFINVRSSSPPSTKHHQSLQMHNGLDSAVLYEILEMMLLRWGTIHLCCHWWGDAQHLGTVCVFASFRRCSILMGVLSFNKFYPRTIIIKSDRILQTPVGSDWGLLWFTGRAVFLTYGCTNSWKCCFTTTRRLKNLRSGIGWGYSTIKCP